MTDRPRTNFGAWTFDPTSCIVTHDLYEVDVEQMATSAETLDWIMQVSAKSWATAEIAGDLVEAIQHLLHLQSNMCAR